MPNIVITYQCNLHCPYCFANEFVNKTKTNMSFEDFKKAVGFIISYGESRVGLIGGEPLIHPEFETFLSYLISNTSVTKVIVFTNGLLIDRFLDALKHPKVELLINCNSPSQIGNNAYNKLVTNVELLNNIKSHDSFSLGLNIYDDCNDYSFIFLLLKKFSLKEVRISLTVPDFSKISTDAYTYYKNHKDKVLRLIQVFLSNNIVPYYDCNTLPLCIWTDEEREYLVSQSDIHKNTFSNISYETFVCNPVIDILPDLNAIRCFGMSETSKVKINSFNNIMDLYEYYKNNIDNATKEYPNISNRCSHCIHYVSHNCMGGCLGFRDNN
jgi:sulfatase maturation enzyme AslB (radical SAM superfamily)